MTQKVCGISTHTHTYIHTHIDRERKRDVHTHSYDPYTKVALVDYCLKYTRDLG